MANELHDASALFYRHLTADATLAALIGTRVYEELAPQGAAYPMVLIRFLAGVDTNAIGADQRIFTRPLFLVEALVTDSNWLVADQIADRFDDLLEGFAGTFGNTRISGTYREAPWRLIETTPEGQVIRRLGGRYRTFVNQG